ncbi:MAG: hypothetical protein JW751_27970 [Polyangiaceae bacterium]|nr:hypothetical protein [Polyangiaceae bacterium]
MLPCYRWRVASVLAVAAWTADARADEQVDAGASASFGPAESERGTSPPGGAADLEPRTPSPPSSRAAPGSARAGDALPPLTGGGGRADAAGPERGDLDGPSVTSEGRVLGPYLRPPMTEERARRRGFARGPLPRDLPFRHDGFYLRAALGIGFLHDRLRGELDNYAFPDDDGRVGRMTAFALGSELALGGTLRGGVVVGMGVYTMLAPAPIAATDDDESYEFELEQLALVCPIADVYPWPNTGWHAQAGIGVGALTVGDAPSPDGESRDVQDHVALGPGFMLGVGREWWIGERWSVGAIARWEQSWGAGTGFDHGRFVHRAGGAVLLLGFTLH